MCVCVWGGGGKGSETDMRVSECECMHGCVLEMQQYIDISSYRDTLGSDTVSIHF